MTTTLERPRPAPADGWSRHLYDLVLDRARRYPNAVAFGSQRGLTWRTVSSREVAELVDRAAAELAAEGVRDGDRVVTWLPNDLRTPIFLFALWKLGAIAVPFDREMNAEAAARIVESVAPALVLTGHGERPEWAGDAAAVEWWEPGSRIHHPPDTPSTPPAEELAVIAFTSGTTGNPKGCMITHANLLSQVEALAGVLDLDPDCRAAGILPLSHLFELTVGMLFPFSRGAAVHYIPSRRGPDIVRVLNEQRITHMVAVPQLLSVMGTALDDTLKAKLPGPAYRAMMAMADRLSLPARRRLFFLVHRRIGGHLRFMASGGAALPAEVQRLWERIGVRVVQGYGTSECSPVVACGNADGSTPIGSVGKPVAGVAVRLAEDGELLVSGPNVMLGYWKDPERTAEVLRYGWYATGDIATIDRSGNIRLAGRAKDLIVLPSGMNVWPEDVESALRAQPGVKDAAVVGSPTPGGGMVLHAYLLPAEERDRGSDVGAIVAGANRGLASHQKVGTASWWPGEDFPRTTTLKVRRTLLPAPGSAQIDAGSHLIHDPVGDAIAAAAKVDAVEGRQTLAELGLDSLALVDLALQLEQKTGKRIADDDLHPDMTVDQVRAFVAGAAVEVDEGAALEGRQAPAESHDWPYTWGSRLRWLAWPFNALFRFATTRVTVVGKDHLAAVPDRVIFAGTHHGFVDLPLLTFALEHSPARRLARKLIVTIAAGRLALAGPYGWYGVLAFGLFPLRQYSDRDASLRRLAKLASRGNPVLIFPQGVHSTPEEERAGAARVRFRPGVAHLSSGLDAPVVPFGVAGTEQMIPPFIEQWTGPNIAGVPLSFRRGPLAIAFGAPMHIEPGESAAAFTARLQAASFELTRRTERALAER